MKQIKIIIFFLFFLMQANFAHAEEMKKVNIYLFWGVGCPHCEKEKIFLETLKQKYSFLEVQEYEVLENKENLKLLKTLSKELKISASSLPITIINKKYIIGFLDENSSGKEIEKAILEAYKNGSIDIVKNHVTNGDQKRISKIPETITVPIFGTIKTQNLSLPLLTILFGALDGFNPCAMWVLVMLISFLMAIGDRRKMLLLGTIFIAASALVYFIFMVAWLNLILFISYIPWIKISIGALAFLGGSYYLKEFFTSKDATCKVTGSKQKKYISEKLSFFIKQKKFYLAALGIVILAFLVNLIELVCSAGLPAIYTQVLALTNLTSLQYYLYILLYIFVFMLDDLIIFFIAVFSLQMVNLTNKYSHYSHLIGGALLVIIGSLLIFKPEWLMF